MEFDECHELRSLGWLEWQQGIDWNSDDGSDIRDDQLHIDLHRPRRYGEPNCVGRSGIDAGTDADARGQSVDGGNWKRVDLNLEFDECDELHGVGWLERLEGDEWQRGDRGAERGDELHAHVLRSGRQCQSDFNSCSLRTTGIAIDFTRSQSGDCREW